MFKRLIGCMILVLMSSIGIYAQHYHSKDSNDSAIFNSLVKAGQVIMYEYPDSAIIDFTKAMQISETDGSEKDRATAYNLLGVTYYIKGEYDQALPLFNKALRLYEKNQDHFGLSSCFNYIGLTYQTQHRYSTAIQYHRKGVAQAALIFNKDRLSINNFNIGLAHDEMGQYDSALHYVGIAYRLSSEINFHRVILMSINRAGMIYLHKKKYTEAEHFFNKALKYKNLTSNWETCLALTGLAQIRDAQGRYNDGIDLASKSFTLAKKMHAKWDIIQATEILATLYSHNKSYKQAYEMILLTQSYKDSLFNEQKDNQINYIHLKENEADKARLEIQNEIQSNALKQSKLEFALVAIVAISLFIIMLILYSQHQQRKKHNIHLIQTNQKIEQQNRALNEANQTKATLFSIISHDMRAPFASLHGFLELLRMDDIDENQRRELFSQLAETYKNVAGTLDNLLHWSRSQMNGLTTDMKLVVVDDLIDKTILFCKSASDNKGICIQYEKRKHEAYVDPLQLKIVIRNILGNAIKFTPVSGNIYISTSEEANETIIRITDTGIGMSPQITSTLFKFQKENQRSGTSQEKGTGLGLMICAQLIEKNGGSIYLESEEFKGSTFVIKIPRMNKVIFYSAY